MPLGPASVHVFTTVLDLGAVGQRRVDRAVPVAGQVDRLVNLVLVVLAVPAQHEGDLDLFEGPGPLLLLLTLDFHRQGLERLLELLEQQDSVDAGAAAERRHEHLGRTHRLVVAEDRGVVDADGVAGLRFDVELDFVPGPRRGRSCHMRTIAASRGMDPGRGPYTRDDTWGGVATLACPVKTAAAPGTAADCRPRQDLYSERFRVEVFVTKSILVSILLIALTDVALQLDNALAISSVAGGVLLAACCLLLFTLVGSNLIDRIAWLKPVAGLALIVIGGKLVFDYFRS